MCSLKLFSKKASEKSSEAVKTRSGAVNRLQAPIGASKKILGLSRTFNLLRSSLSYGKIVIDLSQMKRLKRADLNQIMLSCCPDLESNPA